MIQVVNFIINKSFGILGFDIPFIVALLIGVILIFFLYQVFTLFYGSRPINKDLNDGLQKLSKYDTESLSAQQFQEINDEFGTIGILSEQWHEFSETVVSIKDNEGNDHIYNTEQVDGYINCETVVSANIHSSWYNSVPGILTGIGLLGTFIAILIGLAHINVGINGEVKGIQGLINGLSGKFLSSVCGLSFSMIFLLIEKKIIGDLEAKCRKFQNKLNGIFKRKSTESILIDINKHIASQSLAFRQFNTDLSGRIKEGFNESMKPTLERMTQAIEDLTDILKKSESDKNGEIITAIKEMSNAIKEQTKSMSIEFANALTGAANSEINKLAQSLANAANFLQGMDEKNKQVEDRLNSLFSNIDESIKQQSEISQKMIKQFEESYSNQSVNLNQSIDQMLKSFFELSERMNKEVNDNLDKQNQKNAEHQDTISKKMVEIIQKFEDSSNTYINKQNQQGELIYSIINELKEQINLFNNLTFQNKGLIEEINKAIRNLETCSSNFSSVSEDSKRSVQLIKESMDHINTAINRYKEDLESSKIIWQKQKEFCDSFDNNLGRVLSEVNQQMITYSNTINGNLNKILTQFDTHLSEATKKLGGSVSDLNANLDDLGDTIETSLSRVRNR